MEQISSEFFQKPALELASSLLGKRLIHETEEGVTAGWIVETEAYLGPHDRAAHSFGNRRTARTEVMFGPPGYVYTYVMHTHCLVNVVAGQLDEPHAVLIRAIEPEEGLSLMYKRRGNDKKEIELTNGPGKLTKAMAITQSHYGHALIKPPLMIVEGYKPEAIEKGPRIGIDGSGEARAYPWRFWIKGNRFVSKGRAVRITKRE